MDLLIVTDDTYGPGAYALLRSIAATTAAPMHVFVVDVGAGPSTRALLGSVGLPLTWLSLTPDQRDVLQSFHRDDAHGHWAVYARLLLGDLLPATTIRVTYLDADALCLRDPSVLAHRDLEGAVLGAVQDRWVSGLHTRRVLGKDDQRPLGVPAYFNSGVLEIDVQAWRRERVWEALLVLLREGRRYAFYDQDPLNVVLAGRWYELDPSWNHLVGPTGTEPSSASLSALEGDRHPPTTEGASIVHFVGSRKPWNTPPTDFTPPVAELVGRHYATAVFGGAQ